MNENKKELVEMVSNGNTEAFEKLVLPCRKSLLKKSKFRVEVVKLKYIRSSTLRSFLPPY